MTVSSRPLSQRRRQRRWLLIVALLAVCLAFLPPLLLVQWGPYVFGRGLSALLQTAVTVQQVSGGWWRGMELHRLTIAASAAPQAPPLVQIERLTVNRALLPLLLSTRPVALYLDDASLHLRQSQDGQWHLASLVRTLQAKGPASSVPVAPPIRLNRQVDVIIHGQLHLGRDGPPHAFAVRAGSASLAMAPLLWQVTLSGPEVASLSIRGHLHNLMGPKPLMGDVDLSLTRLPLALAAALLPAMGALQPQGYIETAQVRLGLEDEAGLVIDVNFAVRHALWSDPADSTVGELTRTQGRLQGRWQESLLTITQATASVAGGEVALQGQLSLTGTTPGSGLEWRLTNLPLHMLLGPPVQRFMLSQASGRITRDAAGYHLESTVQVPEFALLPAAIDDRTLRLTQLTLHCTVTATPPFTSLGLEACAVQAAEAQLALQQGTVRLGAAPQLTVEVDGWLGGPFVNALVPEIPVQFPAPLSVHGPLTVALHGQVWRGMQWRLAVRSERCVFEEMAFAELEGTVVKSVDQLDIIDVRAARGVGGIQLAGSWRLAGVADGDMQIQAEQIPLQRALVGSTTGARYLVEGTVSGPVQVKLGTDGVQYTVDQQVSALRLHRETAILAQIPAARVHGTLGLDRSGTWWARQVEVSGETLTLTVRHARLQAPVLDTAAFWLDATLEGEGPELTGLLEISGVEGVRLSGRTQVTAQVQGRPADVFKTTQGQGSVRAVEVSFHGQPLTAVDMAYELLPGRLRITHGVLGYKDGTLTVQGSLGIPMPTGTSDDHLVVSLRQIPVEHSQQLTAFRGSRPAILRTHTVLNGAVTLRGSQHGRLSAELDVRTTETTRQVRHGDSVLVAVELPAVRLTGEASTTRPDEHWEDINLQLQGDGLRVDLKDASVRRLPAYYDMAGTLHLHASDQVAPGLSLGLLPAALELTGAVELTGTAGVPVPLSGSVQPHHVLYVGDLRLARLQVAEMTLESLVARLQVAQGQMTVTEGAAGLLGGRVRLGSASFLTLQGPSHDFRMHLLAERLGLQVHSGQRLALSKTLFLLSPLFLLEPEHDKPVDISGVLEGEIRLTGRYDTQPGWSKSVYGDGHFRIADGAVVGSTLVSGFVSKALLLPQNVVHNVLKELFTKDGKVEQALQSLGRRAFVFGRLASPIRVQAGVVRLQEDLTITSPELSLVLNGHSTLEGDVNYRVRSDLIHRLRFGELTSLPNKIPLVGKALRYANPFTLLEGIELEATVQGNVFQIGPDGRPAVHVDTSLIR